MSSSPEGRGYGKKAVYTSDPNFPDVSWEGPVRVQAVRICKVCKQPFQETETRVVCSRCGHLAHASHSQNYDLKPHDFACIAELSGINNRSFKYLYGINSGYSEDSISEAAGFNDEMVEEIRNALTASQMVEQRTRWFLFNAIGATYKAKELLPVLQEVYFPEPDVKEFRRKLGEDVGDIKSAPASSETTEQDSAQPVDQPTVQPAPQPSPPTGRPDYRRMMYLGFAIVLLAGVMRLGLYTTDSGNLELGVAVIGSLIVIYSAIKYRSGRR